MFMVQDRLTLDKTCRECVKETKLSPLLNQECVKLFSTVGTKKAPFHSTPKDDIATKLRRLAMWKTHPFRKPPAQLEL